MTVVDFCALNAKGYALKTKMNEDRNLKESTKRTLKNLNFPEVFGCLLNKLTEEENIYRNFVNKIDRYVMRFRELRKKL